MIRLLLLPIIAFALSTAAQAVPNNITFAWNANPEPDIAGYRLHWGAVQGMPSTTIDVGNVTTYGIFLLPGTYFAVVTAYNEAGLESLPSNELIFAIPETGSNPPTPTLIILRPNGVVQGGIKFVFNVPTGQCLIIEKSIDLVNWEPVTTADGGITGEVRMTFPKKKQEFFRWTLVPCDVAEANPN
jgi:hypothetical protein